MPFIKYDFTFSQEFNNSQFVKISYVYLDKLETIKYTKGKQEIYEYFKALTRISLKDIENILANSRIVKKDKTLEGVYQSMLMFYKEDGSYDVKAFYEHRLIDEYQEGYGVGEDVGEARGMELGMERGRMLERTNIIGSLSNRGLSNDEISNITSIPIEEVEKILNPNGLKLKRKIH